MKAIFAGIIAVTLMVAAACSGTATAGPNGGDVVAIKDGTAEADAFAGVLGRVVPTAATMGVTFDQVTAALAGMTLTGLSADEAATSLNQVLVSLLKPTKEAEKALKEMGTSSADLRKQLKEEGLLAVLRDLEGRFGANEEAASLVFGNVRALRGVLSLLSLDAGQLNTIFADTASATGALGEAFAATDRWSCSRRTTAKPFNQSSCGCVRRSKQSLRELKQRLAQTILP